MIHSQEMHDDINCCIGVVIDGRRRLKNMGMPSNYFGNVLSLPFVEAQATDLKNQPLSWSAELIHDVVCSAASEEHFQSLIDFVEMIRLELALATIYCRRDIALQKSPGILVSSGLKFHSLRLIMDGASLILEATIFLGAGKPVMPCHNKVLWEMEVGWYTCIFL